MIQMAIHEPHRWDPFRQAEVLLGWKMPSAMRGSLPVTFEWMTGDGCNTMAMVSKARFAMREWRVRVFVSRFVAVHSILISGQILVESGLPSPPKFAEKAVDFVVQQMPELNCLHSFRERVK